MARKLAIDSKAVAYAVIEELLTEDATEHMWDSQDANGIAHHLLEAADVEYLPRARRLTLSFDLSGDTTDPDEPVPYVPMQLDHSAAENAAAAADAIAAEFL